MKIAKPLVIPTARMLTLVCCSVSLLLGLGPDANAYPIGGATFKDDQPFQGASGPASLTSSDGLFTVEAWADKDATIPATLLQWWWIFGVENPASTTDNSAYLDEDEALTLQFDTGVGASHIAFLYSGGMDGTTNNLARVAISGFLSDPGAYATTYLEPRIFNLSYATGSLSFDYIWDTGNDYGQLVFANPEASRGQRLKITAGVSTNGDAQKYGMALFRVSCQEAFGRPSLSSVSVRHNAANSYTTSDGGLTVKAFADRAATIPANFGNYVDQCFGVYGGENKGSIDTDESVTLQFAPGNGLGRLDCAYSSGQVTISGFLSDPGLTDLGNGSFGAVYADGTLSFYPMDTGYHRYFFKNRAASLGQTLKITVETSPGAGYQFGIAAIDYVGSRTVLGADLPVNLSATHTTPDGLLTVNAYADTPGTVPANLNVNVDWFGIAGGSNGEAIEGAESLAMQFAGGTGLAGYATRYTSGKVVLSGFTSDPGFVDPSGLAKDISYSGGTLSYTFDAFRAPEYAVSFSNVAASAGRTLTLRTDGGSGGQIALTRINYATAPVTVAVSIGRQGSGVVLTWPTGILQQSSTINGTFSDVDGAVSPYPDTITGNAKFYRVRIP